MPIADPGLPAAHPWRRFMGIGYESIILFGILWFVDYAFSALTRFQGEPGTLRHVFQGLQVLVLGVYFIGFWSRGRRSLPMKTVSLQLVSVDGGPVSPTAAAIRYFAALAMVLIGLALAYYVHPAAGILTLLPFAWTVIDRDKQAIYDRIARTRLVTTPDQPI